MARAHRIGKTMSVCVSRLLTSKTYEMHMFHSVILKLVIDRAVLVHQRKNTEYDGSIDGSPKKKNKPNSKIDMQEKEIDEIFKKGAYDEFRDDNDTEAKQFMETDIE